MEGGSGDHRRDNERGGEGAMPLLSCWALAVRVRPVQFVVFISFPRERSVYSAVHMCGIITCKQNSLHGDLSIKGSWPETSRRRQVAQFTGHDILSDVSIICGVFPQKNKNVSVQVSDRQPSLLPSCLFTCTSNFPEKGSQSKDDYTPDGSQ